MEVLIFKLKIKIIYENKEILKIKTPNSYYSLRAFLSSSIQCPIPDSVVLKHMNDSGDYLIIDDEASYKIFLNSTNGLCHYIEIFEDNLKFLYDKEEKWECYKCFHLNLSSNLTCICGKTKSKNN